MPKFIKVVDRAVSASDFDRENYYNLEAFVYAEKTNGEITTYTKHGILRIFIPSINSDSIALIDHYFDNEIFQKGLGFKLKKESDPNNLTMCYFITSTIVGINEKQDNSIEIITNDGNVVTITDPTSVALVKSLVTS